MGKFDNYHKLSTYPLCWPDSWKRTLDSDRREARFGKRAGRRISIQEGMNRLLSELERIFAKDITISTNIPVLKNGRLSTLQSNIVDPGVAVYFTLNGVTPCCFACDKWDKVGDNLCAISSHIKTMRDQIRWGVGTTEMAFRGYATAAESWWAVLGVSQEASKQEAQAAYRKKAREVHPDLHGGDHDKMAYLNKAWEQARQYFDMFDVK